MKQNSQSSFTKRCFVPNCPNSDRFTVNENKIFLTIPSNTELRRKWYEAAGRDFSRSGCAYCCEDHFDLENDAQNWIQFKLMGTKIQLKKHVVPRVDVADRKPDSQFSVEDREVKNRILTAFNSEKPQPTEYVDTGPSTPVTKSRPRPLGELVETLQMQYWAEELSPAQLEMVSRRESEYKEMLVKLESMAKQNGGEVIYKGDTCMAYQFATTTNPPALTSFSQSNGTSTPDMSNVVLTTGSKQTAAMASNAAASQNTYKLVMDPRLGLIVGTMTPAAAPPVQQQPQPTPPPTTRPRRGRPAAAPVQYTPPPMPHPPLPPPAPAPQAVRPAESTAVGGLAAGTPQAKPPPQPAIVDLTADDGRPPPDSREVAFNKLQGKTFPSLVVVARPHLHAKEAASMNDRSVLDTKVKSVLVHTPTKFTEWLIQQGLVRSEQHCSIHPANKLNLGMYSDVTKFPYSGGYVWISECCPHRFVSVFSGSLFEGAAHPPTVLLKLLYHWACQTNIQNVVQWVKVDNLYVKGLFTWLRAVCSYALQQHLKPMGGPGKRIEVGVISLGTTSQDGSQRQVKVEVLGILDPELRLIRLRAVEPLADGERNYKRRFSKILEPLRGWVHPDSIIATDLTVDKGTLHFMGFANIMQSTGTGAAGNQQVMEYLRKIVPRMFQNTLSLLSRQIIQQFLDELVWREWYGQTAAQTFNNMVVHLAEQTRMNAGESLIQRLNKVAANPFKNHTVVYQSASAPGIAGPQRVDTVKRYGRKRAAGPTSAYIDLEKTSSPSNKRLHLDTTADSVPTEAMVPLESYYYGTMEGDVSAPLAQRVTLNVRCCVCKVPYTNNIALLDHLLAHAHNMGSVAAASQCRYCLAALPSVQDLNTHIADVHPVETRCNPALGTGNVFRCVLCEQRFASVYSLGKHLSREHQPQELPYQCGTCGFRTSSHRHAIDHFYAKHDGAATVQCPFCLKSTAVWSSGRIMSTNVTFFLAHLQKHQKKTQAKKCGACALWFIQKETLKEHAHKAHTSLVGKKGVKCWPLPTNYALVPKSRRYHQVASAPELIFPAPPPEPEHHNLTLMVDTGVRCVECGASASSTGHFPRRGSCESCRYVTDCAAALRQHRCAGDIPRLALSAELHCCCGYASDCGNRMAKHLALCERKTAYPSAERATTATLHNTHSMLDVLGLVRKHEEITVEAEVITKAEVSESEVVIEETKVSVSGADIVKTKEDIPVVEIETAPGAEDVEPAVEIIEPATEPEVSSADVATQPEVDATQPKADATQPEADATQPEADAMQPDADAVQPDADVSQLDAVVSQPDAVVTQPEVDVTQPEADVVQPEPDVAQPVVDVAQPEADVVQPKTDVVQPETDIAQHESDVVQLEPDVAQLEPDVTQPETDATLPEAMDTTDIEAVTGVTDAVDHTVSDAVEAMDTEPGPADTELLNDIIETSDNPVPPKIELAQLAAAEDVSSAVE